MTLQRVFQQGARRLWVQLALLSPLLLTQCEQEPTDRDSSPVGAGPGGGIAGQPGASAEAGTGPGTDAGGMLPPATSIDAAISPGPIGSGGTPAGAGAPLPDAGAVATDAGPPAADAQADAAPPASGGAFPAVSDFKQPGPFTPTRADGPSGYVLFYPKELGKDGLKHPIVSWGPGALEDAGIFSTMLNHLASHGFAVISYNATPQGQELVKGIDWMLAEHARMGSVFFGKLDPGKISAGGHSAGSLATFVIGADKRLTTTMHISGGTFDPHTDIKNLHAPALFVCGESGGDGLLVGDVANPNCEIDFMNATVPVFYGITKGASHMTPTDIGDAAIRTHQLGAMVGWLRWQLGGDQNAKQLFVGSACTLCGDAAWSTKKQKNLN